LPACDRAGLAVDAPCTLHIEDMGYDLRLLGAGGQMTESETRGQTEGPKAQTASPTA
jgi:hypothetical protein